MDLRRDGTCACGGCQIREREGDIRRYGCGRLRDQRRDVRDEGRRLRGRVHGGGEPQLHGAHEPGSFLRCEGGCSGKWRRRWRHFRERERLRGALRRAGAFHYGGAFGLGRAVVHGDVRAERGWALFRREADVHERVQRDGVVRALLAQLRDCDQFRRSHDHEAHRDAHERGCDQTVRRYSVGEERGICGRRWLRDWRRGRLCVHRLADDGRLEYKCIYLYAERRHSCGQLRDQYGKRNVNGYGGLQAASHTVRMGRWYAQARFNVLYHPYE